MRISDCVSYVCSSYLLNLVYFGGGSYGIDAASRTFVGHGDDRLSLSEAAIIAGLVKAPSNYSPTADVEAARGRAGVVINSMVSNGFISASADRQSAVYVKKLSV